MARTRSQADAWGVVPHYERSGTTVSPSLQTQRALLAAMRADRPRPPAHTVTSVRSGRSKLLRGAVEVLTEEGTTIPIVDDRLPAVISPGYHRVSWRDGRPSSRLIVSPGRCYLPRDLRAWGWAIQLYALRSRSSWGHGDIGDLRRFTRWARSGGAGVTVINPLHAVSPRTPQQPSPYYPGSRLWRNPLYLDISAVPGAAEAEVDLEALAAAGRALNDGARIDRDAVFRLKMKSLEQLWRRSDSKEPSFGSFRDRYGATLEGFTTFAALSESIPEPRRGWPTDLQHPRRPGVARFRAEKRDRIDFHAWLQWLLDMQVSAAADEGVLVQDLAVGVDPSGADAWMWQDLFAQDVTVGAPPDAFNADGQNWGVLAFDPWRLAQEEYEPFIQTIRLSLAQGGGLRLDHVMGLWRLFWIPSGSSPADGAYVRYPTRLLLDIVALESARSGAFVIGEDLGTVEPEVRREMDKRNMLSCKIFWFEDDPPATYPRKALAAATTHDLPTVAGLWSGEDLTIQRSIGLNPDEAAHDAVRSRAARMSGVGVDATEKAAVQAIYQMLAKTPSALVVATLEDALEVRARPNYPGTVDEWPNWSLPLPRLLEELVEEEGTHALAATLARRSQPPAGTA